MVGKAWTGDAYQGDPVLETKPLECRILKSKTNYFFKEKEKKGENGKRLL